MTSIRKSFIYMGDFEYLISVDGVPEGYIFNQTDSSVIVQFDVPLSLSNSLYVKVSSDGQSICAGVTGESPIVCGTLFDRIDSHTYVVKNSTCRISLEKSVEKPWNLLISGECEAGIDPKSLFMLGVDAEFSENKERAWDCYMRAAESGYLTAKLLVVHALSDENNKYGVLCDNNAVIAHLESVPSDSMNPFLSMFFAEALIKAGRKSQAREVLSGAAEKSQKARLMLTTLLDSMYDESGEVAKERVHHLTILANCGDTDAMELLAMCYAHGNGVAKNLDRAKELIENAGKDVRIDTGLSKEVPIIAGIIVCGVVVGAVLAIAMRKNKKNIEHVETKTEHVGSIWQRVVEYAKALRKKFV